MNRTFICFVCSSPYNDFPEFVSHILKEHEEGREYLLCPLQRCKVPVRDLRAHFKAKHPFDRLPNGQHRAIVFYDTKDKKRKKTPNFETGTVVSEKNGGKPMHYRSKYEKEVYLCLESMGEVSRYMVEPFSIDYYLHGKCKQYFPDLLVEFADGKVEVWEIKPKKQTGFDINKAKWNACKIHCSMRGWKFNVITEQEISDMKNNLKKSC